VPIAAQGVDRKIGRPILPISYWMSFREFECERRAAGDGCRSGGRN
jgi:hypothetical protein